MTPSSPSRTAASVVRRAFPLADPRVWLVLATVAVLVVTSPGRALADTSVSSGTAATVTLAGGSVVGTGAVNAQNDGQSATDDQYNQPLLSLLGNQSLLSAGTLSQRAVAFADGTSAACAGVTGTGGGVTIANDGSCTVANGSSQGVTLNLGTLLGQAVTLKADAITASCYAKSDGTTEAKAGLVNANITAAGLLNIPLSSNPTVNQGVSVPGIATIVLNGQTSSGAGNIQANALQLSLVGSLVAIIIGHVSCGTNVITAPTPAIPHQVIPIFAAAALAAGFSRPGRRLLGQLRTTVTA